jgi:1,2-diacylglycerol 3-alpha-glucosyltransferase
MTGGAGAVALIHQQFGPYHVARAKAFERRLGRPAHFIQLASQEALRAWEIRGEAPTLLTVAEGVLEQIPAAELAARLTVLLDRLSPSAVVIAGYAHPAMRAAARWCRRRRAPSILLSDSHRVDRRRLPWKEWAKRTWVPRHFDAAFTAGSLSTTYARGLGFDASQIWRGYDVVDNAFFEEGADTARARGIPSMDRYGLPEKVFLYVGRFSREKNLERLLDAMIEYRRRAGARAWGLLLVGSGPEGPSLERRVRSMAGVAITGFKQIDELPQVYAAAHALILPSVSEPWGLVINEAMAAGLPVLVSDRAGAALDLVFPGINGYIFNPLSQRDMVDAMCRLSSDEVDREAMARASRRIIAGYTPETWSTALADCIEVTAARIAGPANEH